MLGAVRDEKIEKDGRNDCPLGDTRMDYAEREQGVVVGAGGHSTAEVAGEPTDKIRMEEGVGDFAKEKVVRNAVEGFGKINCGY